MTTVKYNTFEKRCRAKWALQAEAPLPKPGRVEYTPEMIAWQSKYNEFMEENFGGRVDMIIVPFIEMPEYQKALQTYERMLQSLEARRPSGREEDFFGYIYDDYEAGRKYERKVCQLRTAIEELKNEAEMRTYGNESNRRVRIGDDSISYDEYIAMVF